MPLPRKISKFEAGYYTGISPHSSHIPKDALIAPSANVVYDEDDHPTSFNGFDWSVAGRGGTTTFALDNGWASLGSNQTSDFGSGNIIEIYNKALLFVGTGTAKALFPSVNASVQTLGTASSIPQIAPLNGAGNGWQTARQLGLAIQGIAPQISGSSSLGAGFIGLLSGSRAFKVSAVRSSTGGVSIASPSSNVVNFTTQSALVDMPPARTDGSDKWRIYATPKGFGVVGFFLQIDAEVLESEVNAGTVNIVKGNTRIKSTGVSRQLEIEFVDQELLDIKAPIDQFPATTASFVSAIGNVTILIGTFRGVGISPSIPNEPESYPPSNATFITEPIVGVSRPQSGFLYVLAENSIWIVMLGGSVLGDTPALARSFVDGIGVKNNKSALTIGDDLYIFSSGNKPVRISSEGKLDSTFGNKVLSAFKNWNANDVVLSYNEQNNTVLYCHKNEIYAYDIDKDRWNAPTKMLVLNGALNTVEADGFIVSAFTRDGVANIVYWVGASTNNYYTGKYNKGTLGSAWIIRSSLDDGEDQTVTKDAVWSSGIVYADAPTTFTGKFYKNGEGVANLTFNIDVPSAGTNYIKTIGTTSYFMRTFSLELSGNGFNHKVISWQTDYRIHRIRN